MQAESLSPAKWCLSRYVGWSTTSEFRQLATLCRSRQPAALQHLVRCQKMPCAEIGGLVDLMLILLLWMSLMCKKKQSVMSLGFLHIMDIQIRSTSNPLDSSRFQEPSYAQGMVNPPESSLETRQGTSERPSRGSPKCSPHPKSGPSARRSLPSRKNSLCSVQPSATRCSQWRKSTEITRPSRPSGILWNVRLSIFIILPWDREQAHVPRYR